MISTSRLLLTCAVLLQVAGQPPTPPDDLKVTVSATPYATPPRTTRQSSSIAISVDVRHRAPLQVAEEKVGIIINVFRHDGRHVTDLHHKVDLKRLAEHAAPAYEVVTRVDLQPGRYVLRVAAGTSDGKTGKTSANVTLPDFATPKLSMAGPILAAEPRVFLAAAPTIKAFLPVVPTAAREFTTRHKLSALARVYQGGKGAAAPVTVIATLTRATGGDVHSDARTLDAGAFGFSRWADYILELPLARLTPGAYVLKINASAGRTTAPPVVVQFTVVP